MEALLLLLPTSPLLSSTRPLHSSQSSAPTSILFPGHFQSCHLTSSFSPLSPRLRLQSPYLDDRFLWFHGCKMASYRNSYRGRFTQEEEEEGDEESYSFEEAVELFNKMEYYKCHDVLEALWNKSQDPTRTLVHGILQCAVGFYHLFNQNHKGAMMELGEGLCKLRKMNFEKGPFREFEEEISAVLDFIHQTQLELAACTEELCLTMGQSERSYQLLGGYAAGQPIYRVDKHENDLTYIFFCPKHFNGRSEFFSTSVKLPVLLASENHFIKFETSY